MGCQLEITKAIIERNSNYIIALKKNQKSSYESVSYTHLSKIDLNQFINLTRRKDMRKILLMRLFYRKKLDFKQLLQTYENHIIPSPACYISGCLLYTSRCV